MPIRPTARDIQAPIGRLELSKISLWPDELIGLAFTRIRDERWLNSDGSANFKRRIPWLFVDNGCFLRAALVRRKFEEWNYPQINKIFCFGSMEFNTPWTKTGTITYKDHVAVILRGSSECFVIDPPVSFDRPLSLDEWIQALHRNGKAEDAKFSICSALTFGHNSYADETDLAAEAGMRGGKMKSVEFFASEFLEKEWRRVAELGLNVHSILGAEPPWANAVLY